MRQNVPYLAPYTHPEKRILAPIPLAETPIIPTFTKNTIFSGKFLSSPVEPCNMLVLTLIIVMIIINIKWARMNEHGRGKISNTSANFQVP